MRFPLKEKIVLGYDYGAPTTYGATHHLGVDWKADYDPLSAPKAGTILDVTIGPQGGKTILFKPLDEPTLFRWLHLDEFKVVKGQQVKEGELLAITGNTGSNTTGPHLHEDIWKSEVTGKFEDTINPHEYYKYMHNITFVHKAGTQEYGFLETTPYTQVYHRATSEAEIKFQAVKFGLTTVITPTGKIDFSKAKEINLQVD